MKKIITRITLGALIVTVGSYASIAGCLGCHGQTFEKAAMGKSKVVKDMSKEAIITALKGYKDGSYGGPMKGLMKGQVASLDDAAIEAMAAVIKGDDKAEETKKETPATVVEKKAKYIDLNEKASDSTRIEKEDLKPEANIFEDLGLDSLDVVDLVVALQKKFSVEIRTDERIKDIRTLEDLSKFIKELKSES